MVIGFGLTAGAGGQAGSHDPIFPTVVDLAAGESPDWNWFDTVFTFFDSSTTSQEVVVITHGSDGGPEPVLTTDDFGIRKSKVSLTLPPGTMKYLRTARTFPAFNGWVRVTASESVKVNARLWVRDGGCTAPLIADGVPPCYPPESDPVPSSVPIAGVQPTTQLAGEAVVRVDHRTSWALVNPSANQPV
jgi:hypothetical protein